MNDYEKKEFERIKRAAEERLSSWMSRFDERQQRLITNARIYAQNDPAGLPGHQLCLIIDKMAELLDGQ